MLRLRSDRGGVVVFLEEAQPLREAVDELLEGQTVACSPDRCSSGDGGGGVGKKIIRRRSIGAVQDAQASISRGFDVQRKLSNDRL